MTRADLLTYVCGLIGSPPIHAFDANEGWPGLVSVAVGDTTQQVALHVSNVSSHSRKDYELRFQNPGSRKPVEAPGTSIPVLVGYFSDDDSEILVGCEGSSRLGREARFSILFNKHIVEEARKSGWSIYTSGAGEEIFAFSPALFPTFLDAVAKEVSLGPEANVAIQDIVAASGLLTDATRESAERARRASYSYVRHQAFSKLVRAAYSNRCAMCGIGLGLTVGAHIYPAAAPKSPDVVTNGIALCQNHHTLFDAHKIWINPKSLKIHIHPEVLDAARGDKSAETFVTATATKLSRPIASELRPDPLMFERRYSYFRGSYDWPPKGALLELPRP